MKTPLILISSLTLAFVLSISTNLSAQTNTNPQTTKSPVKQTVTQTAKKPVEAKPVAKPAVPVAPPAVAAPTNEQIIKEFESYVGKVQKEWMIPGMAVSVMKDGKLIFAKGFGVKDINGKLPVDVNTVFQIGSVSKSFTAAVMASLVDEGKIKW
ncbi:MAG: serine hydrolase, partial [Bacteroidales bacterium]|nr:serine hydrolase [Bacteroidales bacterium]